MTLEGIIEKINIPDNTCLVRIPAFEPAGSDKAIIKANFSTFPGITLGYKRLDAVYVVFEENDYQHAFIVGKKYINLPTELSIKNNTQLNIANLTVTKDAAINTLVVKGELKFDGTALSKLGTTLMSTLTGSEGGLNNTNYARATKYFSETEKVVDKTTKITTFKQTDIGVFNPIGLTDMSPKLVRQEFIIDVLDKTTADFPLNIKVPFTKEMTKCQHMIKVNPVNTIFKTSHYTITPGFYYLDLMGEPQAVPQIFEVKPNFATGQIMVYVSKLVANEMPDKIFLTVEYS